MSGDVLLTGGLMVTGFRKRRKEIGLLKLHCGPADDRIHKNTAQ